jgi:hypothetical protein
MNEHILNEAIGPIVPRKRSKKLLGVPVVLVVLLVFAVVIASLLTYVVNVQISATKEAVLEYRWGEDGETWSDWADADTVDLVWDVGEVYSYEGIRYYQIRCKSDYTGSANVMFDITEEDPSIITVMDRTNDIEIVDESEYGLSSTLLEFEIQVDIDVWLCHGYDYSAMGVKIIPVV